METVTDVCSPEAADEPLLSSGGQVGTHPVAPDPAGHSDLAALSVPTTRRARFDLKDLSRIVDRKKFEPSGSPGERGVVSQTTQEESGQGLKADNGVGS
jgi:hypothetical protein